MEKFYAILQLVGIGAGFIVVFVAMIATYVIAAIVAWKKYDYFATTVLSSISTTGFQYHCKKIGMSCIVVPIVSVIVVFGGVANRCHGSDMELKRKFHRT